MSTKVTPSGGFCDGNIRGGRLARRTNLVLVIGRGMGKLEAFQGAKILLEYEGWRLKEFDMLEEIPLPPF